MAIRSLDSLFDSTRPSWRLATGLSALIVLGGLIHLVIDQHKVTTKVPEPPAAHVAEHAELATADWATAMLTEP